MKNMKKIKFYLPIYLLTTGLAFMSPCLTAFAEEEEEVLYQEEDGEEVQFQEIEDESEKTPEEIAKEEEARQAEEAQKQADAEAAMNLAQQIEQQKAAEAAIIGSTTIDPEDQEYDTGRNEIPSSVQTEAERKNIDKIPPGEKTPPPTTSGNNPEQPNEQQEQTPSTSVGTPIETPKMGIEFDENKAVLASMGIFGLIGVGLGFKRQYDLNKVLYSRKAYGKKQNKKKKRTRTR